MNLCKDCKHVRFNEYQAGWCSAIVDYTNPVTGNVNHPWCLTDDGASKAARKGGACGPEGKLFEQAPPLPLDTALDKVVGKPGEQVPATVKLICLAILALAAGILATLVVR